MTIGTDRFAIQTNITLKYAKRQIIVKHERKPNIPKIVEKGHVQNIRRKCPIDKNGLIMQVCHAGGTQKPHSECKHH